MVSQYISLQRGGVHPEGSADDSPRIIGSTPGIRLMGGDNWLLETSPRERKDCRPRPDRRRRLLVLTKLLLLGRRDSDRVKVLLSRTFYACVVARERRRDAISAARIFRKNPLVRSSA